MGDFFHLFAFAIAGEVAGGVDGVYVTLAPDAVVFELANGVGGLVYVGDVDVAVGLTGVSFVGVRHGREGRLGCGGMRGFRCSSCWVREPPDHRGR